MHFRTYSSKRSATGILLKANIFPWWEKKRKTPLATKKLILSYNPLDMHVPFETYFEPSKSWVLRDKVCEKTRQHWLNCFSTHSLRTRASDQMAVEVREEKKKRFKVTIWINSKQHQFIYLLLPFFLFH